MNQGTQVGVLARGYFPGGEHIKEEYLNHDAAMTHTQRAVADKEIPALYEAAFRHDDVRIRADLLARAPRGTFDLAEVKSSTQVKDEHLWDVAIQAWVIRGAGLELRRSGLLRINRDYVYPGGEHDPRKLLALDDFTEEVEPLLPKVPDLLEAMRAPLWEKRPPDVPVGDQCHSPYECPFLANCHPPGPEHPITDLYRAGKSLMKRLAADGIAAIPDIPEGYKGLSGKNQRIRDVVVSGNRYVDPDIRAMLAKLKYPVFFLDFETINPAIPLYVGTRPYDQIPFQWSIHRLDKDGALSHFEYLHDGADDPRPALLDSMLRTLGGKGDILVYSSFEETRLKAMRAAFPEIALPIEKVIGRLVDLLPPIREHVYHPEFHGSFSIKSVYPALVAGSGYDDLAITDGGSATAAFITMMNVETAPEMRGTLRNELLKYCRRDTEAMVEVYRKFSQ
jgi:hypothetical protein